MAWANSRLSTVGTRNAAVGSVPDGGAGGAGSVSQRKALFRLLIRLEEGQACPLEALITQALSSKIAMKPGDIRDKKELAEELRLAAEKEEKNCLLKRKPKHPVRRNLAG